MKKYLIVLISIIILCGCSTANNSDNIKQEEQEFITATEINKIMSDDNYILLDVRTKEEYSESHIVDSINIPYDEIINDVELDKSKIILIYCRSGKRASIALENLESLGYTAYNMGGIDNINLPKE